MTIDLTKPGNSITTITNNLLSTTNTNTITTSSSPSSSSSSSTTAANDHDTSKNSSTLSNPSVSKSNSNDEDPSDLSSADDNKDTNENSNDRKNNLHNRNQRTSIYTMTPFNKRRKSKISAQHFNTVYHQYNKCFQNYYHCYQYLKPNCTFNSNIKPSVNHWQLRDLVKFNAVSNQVYYTKDDSIYKYQVDDYSIDKYIKLNYYPRCFDHSQNYTVTGGLLTTASKLFSLNLSNLTYDNCSDSSSSSSSSFASTSRRISKGLFSFYNPELDKLTTVKLGEMINNDVTLYKSTNNSFQSYICNNDTFLYCVDINNSDLRCFNKINCESNTCLNNVIKNPKSDKILAATGDSSSIFLIDPSSKNSIIKTINSGHDSGGFGVDYHANGLLFSTVFQDGICQIYDIRNLSQKLIEIKSTRPGHQSGAFRVVKFSPENDLNDLLIISEHVGRVHLIDLRNLNYDNVDDHQVVVIPSALTKFAEFKKNVYEDQQQSGKPINIYNTNSNNVDSIMHDGEEAEEEEEEEEEYDVDNELSFTAPLVYDYDYLANIQPKLFKDFNYLPPIILPKKRQLQQQLTRSRPTLNTPQWHDNNSGSSNFTEQEQQQEVSPRSSARPSFDFDSQLNDIYMEYGGNEFRHNQHPQSPPEQATSITASSSYMYSTYCDDSYQQSTNHFNGEMELSGIEFMSNEMNSKILIGCQDSGMLMWDINGVSRRSAGSFEFV
ncbi:conserved hypothetical protein [Candida tropicalis MYA-3404]|uniref:DUF2415 domain-containing protein n=1 Tax=Candida tropicalis (strain ATCC MYA-3404 / T1) TaxID=294747 RepID=C5MGL0_CANTT|nr:conserved hypothetical protein [Candida tropicalis MYA-3404]EER31473.1 conserved hypothetical protein [Candida tropicalis MYA-3404]KAG4405043.1 hypothetical protein JTP64_006057 [Candida tropicalis]